MGQGIVKFVRIHGHIVPIKEGGSPDANNKKKAAANVAAGLGVAAAGGTVSANLHRQHANHFNTSRNMRGDLFNRKFSVKTRMEGIRAMKAGTRIKNGSAVAGSALIAAGVHKSLKNSDLDEKEKAYIAATSGLGAHFAIRSAYTKTLGNTSVKYAVKHAFGRILVRGTKL